MTRMPPVSVDDLTAAYRAWPAPEYDKTRLHALVLRVRIERLVATLPTTVIAAKPDSARVRQRLLLSIGEPGLTSGDRVDRLRTVWAAAAAYDAICDLLHGRNPDPNPPLQDLAAWAAAVDDLECGLAGQPLPTRSPPTATATPVRS